jgi:hypothetical protein
MSPLALFLVALCIVFLAAALCLTAALFVPVVVILDFGNGEVRMRWLGLLEYTRPLPGSPGEASLYMAGRLIRPARRQPGKGREPAAEDKGRSPAGAKPDTAVQARHKFQSRWGRFLLRCLSDSVIRRSLVRQLANLWKSLWRTFALRSHESTVCLYDPALNGMLAGTLAALGRAGQCQDCVNFTGENRVVIKVRPHHVVGAAVVAILRLPYRAIFRQWRASAA